MSQSNLSVPPDYASDNSKMPRPYIDFFIKAIERRQLDGSMQYVDEHWIKITALGGKDTVEKPFSEWIVQWQAHADAGRIPRSWPGEYKQAFEQWKKDGEMPILGTPIKSWSVLTPAQRENVLRARIFTVEDLALANDECRTRIGMGANHLIEVAKRWVEEQKGPGALAAQLEVVLTENQGLQQRVSSLEEQLKQLLPLIPKEHQPVAVEKPSGQVDVKE